MAAPPDRRPRLDLVGLPARRDDVHRGHRGVRLPPDPDRVVGAAGRGMGRLGDGLLSLSRSVSKYFPTGGATRAVGLSFGSSSAVQQVWNNSDAVAVRIQRNADGQGQLLLARRDLRPDRRSRLGPTASATRERGAGEPLLAGLGDDIAPTGRHSFTYIVNPDSFNEGDHPGPGHADPGGREDPPDDGRPGRLLHQAGARRRERPVLGHDPDRGPGQRSRAAQPGRPARCGRPTIRPRSSPCTPPCPPACGADSLEALQTQILGDGQVDGADRHRREARRDAPIDGRTNIRPTCRTSTAERCPRPSASPRTSAGFCQWYAPTMAVVLRHLGIPARIVEGFLPGSRDAVGRDRGAPQQQRPRLGRGLLPGLRLGRVRPDRRQPADAVGSAAGRTGRCQPAAAAVARRDHSALRADQR